MPSITLQQETYIIENAHAWITEMGPLMLFILTDFSFNILSINSADGVSSLGWSLKASKESSSRQRDLKMDSFESRFHVTLGRAIRQNPTFHNIGNLIIVIQRIVSN